MTMLPNFLSDSTINYDSLPLELEGATAYGVLWQARQGAFLLDVPDVARYLVKAGRFITIDPSPYASTSSVEYHLRLLPMASLLYQRGLLAFHAAVVAKNEFTFLIAGGSGSGKSTILTALLQRGWTMLSDDLAAVDLNNNNQIIVYPTYSEIALWPESLESLGINSSSLPFCDTNRKLLLPEQFNTKTRQLCGIYLLGIHNKSNLETEKIATNSCFQTIGAFLYNSHIADALCDRLNYLRCVAAISNSIPITNLRRPRGKWSVEELVNFIET